MSFPKGEQLLNELLERPLAFNKSRYKGYELLNEYLAGFPVETLVPAFLSDNPAIYRIAISITSELSEENCSTLLPHLIPLLKKEEDPLYLHYALEGVFSGTYRAHHHLFYHIILHLRGEARTVRTSSMHLVSCANLQQLTASHAFLKRHFQDHDLLKGLAQVIEEVNSGLPLETILSMINGENRLFQLFGGIISKRRQEDNPHLMAICQKSLNEDLRKFAEGFG